MFMHAVYSNHNYLDDGYILLIIASTSREIAAGMKVFYSVFPQDISYIYMYMTDLSVSFYTQGAVKLGGISEVWEECAKWGRLNFDR